jgi:hypothetical protein
MRQISNNLIQLILLIIERVGNMSHRNYLLKILNLKDENIVFNENFYSEEVIKGIKSQIYHGT